MQPNQDGKHPFWILLVNNKTTQQIFLSSALLRCKAGLIRDNAQEMCGWLLGAACSNKYSNKCTWIWTLSLSDQIMTVLWESNYVFETDISTFLFKKKTKKNRQKTNKKKQDTTVTTMKCQTFNKSSPHRSFRSLYKYL